MELHRFTEKVNAGGIGDCAPTPTRLWLLDRLIDLAVNPEGIETCASWGREQYTARLVHDDPAGWSLALVVLPPGGATPPHDHESWGCAAVIEGVECNRFLRETEDGFAVAAETEFRRGEGYIFNEGEVHSPLGAAPDRLTLSLHLLVRSSRRQECMEGQHSLDEVDLAAPPRR